MPRPGDRRGERKDRDDRREKRKYTKFRKDNRCRFCRDKTEEVDYKDVNTLFKLTTGRGKMYPRKRSGNCAYHQRSSKKAIKQARYMALLPYVDSGTS